MTIRAMPAFRIVETADTLSSFEAGGPVSGVSPHFNACWRVVYNLRITKFEFGDLFRPRREIQFRGRAVGKYAIQVHLEVFPW